jgi:hypothetical protein
MKPSVKQRSTTIMIAALALALATGASGCDLCDGERRTLQEVSCAHAGSVQVVSPTCAVPSTAQVTQGATCLTPAGTCDAAARALFLTPGSGNYLVLQIDVAPTIAPGTYALTANDAAGISIAAQLENTGGDPVLIVRSGELAITQNDAVRFSGTFAIELDTADGMHHVSLTNGSFDAEDCAIGPHEYCDNEPHG